MKNMLRDGRFWACTLLFAGLFGLALYFEHIDRYHPFPYILVLHALTIFSWLAGLYYRWNSRWKPGDGRAWGILVLLCAIPQALMCMVSYISWACLGVSLVLGVGSILCSKR